LTKTNRLDIFREHSDDVSPRKEQHRAQVAHAAPLPSWNRFEELDEKGSEAIPVNWVTTLFIQLCIFVSLLAIVASLRLSFQTKTAYSDSN